MTYNCFHRKTPKLGAGRFERLASQSDGLADMVLLRLSSAAKTTLHIVAF